MSFSINLFSSAITTDRNISFEEEAIVIAKSGLNLRKEPGISNNLILTIPYNSKVLIKSISPDFIFIENILGCWIKYENSEGYVFSGFLSLFSNNISESKYKIDKSTDIFFGICRGFIGDDNINDNKLIAAVELGLNLNSKINVLDFSNNTFFTAYTGNNIFIDDSEGGWSGTEIVNFDYNPTIRHIYYGTNIDKINKFLAEHQKKRELAKKQVDNFLFKIN